MKAKLVTTFFISFTLLTATVHAQWGQMGVTDTFNGAISCVFADASGNVYASGAFTNDSSKYYVAKWNGTSWSEMRGTNSLDANGLVATVCSDPSGNIFAAGNFTNSIGNYYVAKWDGSSWTNIAPGIGLSGAGGISSMCSDASGNIYAAGDLVDNGGYYDVFKWNGAGWHQLGTASLAANSYLRAVCSDRQGNIYAAGEFTNGYSKWYVAKYNGSTWSELGGTNALGADDYIWALCSDSAGNIYAAGDFLNSSYNHYVAKFDGTSWSELGGTNALAANNTIASLYCSASGNIYAAGDFTDSAATQYVAVYNGSTWSAAGGPHPFPTYWGISVTVNSICADTAGKIYAAGTFVDSAGRYYVDRYAVPPTVYRSWADTTCQDRPVTIGAHLYTQSGTYTDTLITAGGGDSIVTLRLTVLMTPGSNISRSICTGSSYIFGGRDLTAPGTYYDTLAGAGMNGCDSIVTLQLSLLADSVHAYFTIQPSSTPHLWYAVNQCTATPPYTLTWSWGDGSPLNVGDTPSHIYDTAGHYTICVTVSDSLCSAAYCDSSIYLYKDQSGQMVYVNVINQLPNGIIQIQDAASIQLYPNPASNMVTITGATDIQTIKIISETGEIVQRDENLSTTQHTLSIARLAKGIYYVQVIGSHDTGVYKLVVE